LELFHKLHSSDDLDAARKLVLAHLRFVVHVAKTYKGYGLPLLDLIQEGNIGLMKAVKRFNPEKKVRLLSFAIYWIRAEIHEFVLKNWRIVKVATTKAQRKLFFKLRGKKTTSAWLTENETQNIAKELDVKPETVTQMESRLSGSDVSFDPSDDELAPSNYLTNNQNPLLKLEYESDGDNNALKLHTALSKLDERSKDIIRQRYLLDNKSTLDKLSKKYNISIERVRQIETKSLSLLKDNMMLA
jgi:RNA polymerase sigma-32 factor